MLSQDFSQALLAELLSSIVERFAYAVSVECQNVSRIESQFFHRTFPFFEKSEYGARGLEPLQTIISSEQETWPMPAVRVPQTSCMVVVLRKKESGISTVLSILVKELIHRLQKVLRLSQGDGTLATKISLQIRHQKRGSNSFSRNISDHQAETSQA